MFRIVAWWKRWRQRVLRSSKLWDAFRIATTLAAGRKVEPEEVDEACREYNRLCRRNSPSVAVKDVLQPYIEEGQELRRQRSKT